MDFVGQDTIIRQLEFILPEIKNGRNFSFMFRGPSGYGKTDLAMRVATSLAGPKYHMKLGDSTTFYPEIRVHLVDEIHLCPTPEIYYPLIDSNEYVFLFTTNSDSNLPEALLNRCIDFVFTDYSDEELLELVRIKADFRIQEDKQMYLINFCNRNPRVILSIIKRLTMWKRRNFINLADLSLEEFKLVSERIFGVKDGLDLLCQRYMQTLKALGGRASLATIKAALHLDEGTIKYQIEPSLLYRGLITITSKGRTIV